MPGARTFALHLRRDWFRIGDFFIYAIIITLLLVIGIKGFQLKEVKGSKVEIYVNSKLEFVEDLKKKKSELFVPTEIGGVNVEFIDNKVRVISSNSPKKLIVKQGFISKAGETLIGVPDKVIIKVTGDSDLDYIIK